jgi:hypothetical protein
MCPKCRNIYSHNTRECWVCGVSKVEGTPFLVRDRVDELRDEIFGELRGKLGDLEPHEIAGITDMVMQKIKAWLERKH